MLHPCVHLRDFLFQFDPCLFGWQHGERYFDFDLPVDPRVDTPCNQGARCSLLEFAHALCHFSQCHDMDGLRNPSERHPAFYDQLDCILLHDCQYDFLSLGEAIDWDILDLNDDFVLWDRLPIGRGKELGWRWTDDGQWKRLGHRTAVELVHVNCRWRSDKSWASGQVSSEQW